MLTDAAEDRNSLHALPAAKLLEEDAVFSGILLKVFVTYFKGRGTGGERKDCFPSAA